MTTDWKSRITGSWVAVVTPFREGRVDIDALRGLVRFHLENGTSGLCPVGTTGEAATLSDEERTVVIRTVVKEAAGKIVVFAGTGTNNTASTIEYSKAAIDAGADGLLVVTPYYNKPPQDALVAHYEAVANATDAPIILYNVPGRTGCNMLPEAVVKLAGHPRIVGLKDASLSLDQASEVLGQCDIALLSGEDSFTVPLIALGATGVISVLGNVVPRASADMVAHAREGRFAEARALHLRLFPLMKALFAESNPIPVKAALAMLGRCEEEIRAPLRTLASEPRARLKAALTKYGMENL